VRGMGELCLSAGAAKTKLIGQLVLFRSHATALRPHSSLYREHHWKQQRLQQQQRTLRANGFGSHAPPVVHTLLTNTVMVDESRPCVICLCAVSDQIR